MGGAFHSTRSLAGVEGIPRKTSISTISSRSPITATNPATHPPDTCFQIVCGTQQSIGEEFIKMRVDLSVWDFRAESNFSDGLPVVLP